MRKSVSRHMGLTHICYTNAWNSSKIQKADPWAKLRLSSLNPRQNPLRIVVCSLIIETRRKKISTKVCNSLHLTIRQRNQSKAYKIIDWYRSFGSAWRDANFALSHRNNYGSLSGLMYTSDTNMHTSYKYAHIFCTTVYNGVNSKWVVLDSKISFYQPYKPADTNHVFLTGLRVIRLSWPI